MANFSVPAPFEPRKAVYLNDRSNRPAAPEAGAKDYVNQFLGFGLGILLSIGFLALSYQTRAVWEGQRDWVVPTTVPFFAMGGVALGFLISRKAWLYAAPGIALLVLVLVLTGLNIWRGEVVSGSDGLRDALSIITGVLVGFMLAALVVGWAMMAWKFPPKGDIPQA